MRTSREDLRVETTSDEKQQRKTKLQSLVNAQMQIVDTQQKSETKVGFRVINDILDRIIVTEEKLPHRITYRAFPPTKKDENSFAYIGAGLTLFSRGRQQDRNTVIEASLSHDKKSWVDNQIEVMDEMRRRFK